MRSSRSISCVLPVPRRRPTGPAPRARAIVKAVTYYKDPQMVAEASRGLGEAMPGLDVKTLSEESLLATRGW